MKTRDCCQLRSGSREPARLHRDGEFAGWLLSRVSQNLVALYKALGGGWEGARTFGPRDANDTITCLEICEIVWLVASEHLYNMTNIGLNIHSDMLCDITRKRKAA